MMKPFSEKFLYHIWDGFHFVNPLKTESGKIVEILFQGRWNTSAGPDFLNAIIKIEGQVLKGDIEIHLDSYDWKRHSHNEDKNYNNVILHIVAFHNLNTDYTISENGNKIEIIKILNFADKSIAKLLKEYKEVKFEPKEKFCYFFAGETKETIVSLLTELGRFRLDNKIKRFNAELSFRSFEQVLYSAVLEAAGYSKNKFQMIKAAEILSYVKLKNIVKKGCNFDEFIAIFLVSSGLISFLPSTFPIQFKNKWIELYKNQNYFNEEYNIDWVTHRIRPVNNPAIRFLQLSGIIYKGLITDLSSLLFSVFNFSYSSFEIKKFQRHLYDFFKKRSSHIPNKYHIGKSRIDTILINIIIPLSILYSKKMQYDKLADVSKMIYESYSALPQNFILDFMSNYMDSNQRRAINKKSITQQGVLSLYYSFCNKHLCELCYENKKELIKNL